MCRSDMLLKGQDATNILCGNSFSEDGHVGRRFDYLLANPPFGLEWKRVADVVRDEHESKGRRSLGGAVVTARSRQLCVPANHCVRPFEQHARRRYCETHDRRGTTPPASNDRTRDVCGPSHRGCGDSSLRVCDHVCERVGWRQR